MIRPGSLGLAAAVAGSATAGLALAGCGSSAHAKPLVVDQSAGRVGRIALGDSRSRVVATLGKPGETNSGGPFTPLGEWFEDIGGPPNLSTPGPGEILRYHHVTVLLIGGRVYSVIVTDPGARTTAGAGVGDRLSKVKRELRHADCGALGSESGHDIPYCTARVRAGRIAFGQDPVKSITLSAPYHGPA